MEKNSKQKEELARLLAEDDKKDGLKINQRVYILEKLKEEILEELK